MILYVLYLHMPWVKNSEIARAGDGWPGGGDPERTLALSYAPSSGRNALAALLALDDTLGQILRTTREPLVGQMRLTWWHAALIALDTAPPPAEPVLQALAAEVLPRGVSSARLAGMIDGWEALLDPEPLDGTRLDLYATGRGAALFEMAGCVLGVDGDPLSEAGVGWALADLAMHPGDGDDRRLATEAALIALGPATARRWSRNGRVLGALTHIAQMNVALPPGQPIAPGAPGRVARLAWHRLTGR